MRHVGDLPTQDQAQRFADYLLVRDVKVNVDQEGDAWSIWAIEEDETTQVKDELLKFRENPDGEQYQGHGTTAQQRRKHEEKANREFRRNQVNASKRWGRGGGRLKAGPVTLSLILISVFVTLTTDAGGEYNRIFCSLTFEKLVIVRKGVTGGTGLEAILSGEVWRLFTPMFIHFDLMHIVFNMLWLNQLGAQIKTRAGKWKYLLLVLAIAGISNASQFFWSQSQHQFSIFGGMSGVVYGLFGYIWMKTRYEPQERYFMHPQTVMFMLIFLVLCMTGAIGPIANAAHLAGLIAGVVFGYARTFIHKFLS